MSTDRRRSYLVGSLSALAVLATVLPAVLGGGVWPARAETAALPTTSADVDARLKTFDPEAVAAARHYYQSQQMRDNMLSMLRNFTPTLLANQEKAQGSPVTPEERARIVKAVDTAMRDNFDLLIQLNMVAALETLSKDELVALDKFYSSPTGQAILTKMPEIGKRMPGIMQVFLPKFTESFRAALKPGTP